MFDGSDRTAIHPGQFEFSDNYLLPLEATHYVTTSRPSLSVNRAVIFFRPR